MADLLDAIRFAPEAARLEAFMRRFGLEPLIKHFEESGGLTSMRDLVLGTQVQLSEVMSPRLFGLLGEVRGVLGYEEPVDLFVAADPSINAFAVYSLDDDPHIVSLTSAMVERMTDPELRFVLGHELGHIRYQHYRARTAEPAIGHDDEGDSRMPALLARLIENWDRLAELSADRAGFLAAGGDLEAIVSAFFKMTSGLGPEHLRFDISAFLAQLEALEKLEKRKLLCGFSHPVTPIRVRALQLFGEAGGAGADPQALAGVDGVVLKLSRLMEVQPSEPLEEQARDFLLGAGLLVAGADGEGVSALERRVLVESLLSLVSDPEEALAAVASVEQGRALLESSTAWLRENAGEERFRAYRVAAMVAAVDGVFQGGQEELLAEIATRLDIPPKVARKITFECLARGLQTQASEVDPLPALL